ncbi:MAG: PilZ domain-containing protein [Hyphomicrobiales bacterium]|nr:PilZ domain-containing protein [Hyphomicrobiales bacterium]
MRKSPRFELHTLGQIEAGEEPLSCIIWDLSEGGARLTVGDVALPDEFTLTLRRRCRVVRRADGQIGVKFIPS